MDQNQPPVAKSGSSPMKFILIGCGILFLCGICCAISFFAFTAVTIGAGVTAIKTGIVEEACQDVDPSVLYENNTTAALRSRMTEAEFAAEIEVLQSEVCNEIEDAGTMDVLTQGWNVSYSNTNEIEELSLTMKVNEKNVDIKMSNEGSGDLKFDSINID